MNTSIGTIARDSLHGKKGAGWRRYAPLPALLPLLFALGGCATGSNGLPNKLPIPNPAGLKFATATVSDGVINRSYMFYVIVSGGTAPIACSAPAVSGLMVTGTTVPPGGNGSQTGKPACLISGTPTVTGLVTIMITASDSSAPPQATSPTPFNVNVRPEFTVTAAAAPLPVGVVSRTYGAGGPAAAPPNTAPIGGMTNVSATVGNAPLTMCMVSGTGGNASLTSPVTATGCALSSPTPLAAAGPFNLIFAAVDSPILDAITGLQVVPASNPAVTVSAAIPFTVNPALIVSAFALLNGEANPTAAYSQTVSTTGGITPQTQPGNPPLANCMNIAAPAPAGVTASVSGVNGANCVFSGTPTATFGPSNVTLTATDAGNTAVPPGTSPGVSSPYTVVPGLAVTAFVLGAGEANVPYAQTLLTTGGIGPLTSCVFAPALPAGLVVTPTGANCVISGTPTVTFGPTVVMLTAKDTGNASSMPGTATNSSSLTIFAALAVTPFTLLDGEANPTAAYSQTIMTTGGNAPLTSCMFAPALPAGLIVTPSGSTCVVSGTPTVTFGPTLLTLTVMDTAPSASSGMGTASGSSNLTIVAGLALPAFVLGAGETGATYAQTIPTTGGIGPLTSCVFSPALPAGLVVTPTGANCVISGTPTVTFGPTVLMLTAIDTGNTSSMPGTATNSSSLTIGTGPSVTAFVLLNGEANPTAAYSQTITITGGNLPLTSCMFAPALPAGLIVTPSGSTCVVSGTPTVTFGPTLLTLTVMDTAPSASSGMGTATGSSNLTIVAGLAVPAFTLGAGAANTAYAQTIPTTGGIGPLTSCVFSPALPAGLVVTPTGANCVISGTPTVTFGPTVIMLTAKDTGNASSMPGTATNSSSLTINAALMVPAFVLLDGEANPTSAYSQTIPTTGGIGPLTSCMFAPALPAGLIVTPSGSTCVVSGTPTVTFGPTVLMLTVMDTGSTSSAPGTASGSSSFTVVASVSLTAFNLGVGEVGAAYSLTVPTATPGIGAVSNCTSSPVVIGGLIVGHTAVACTVTGPPTSPFPSATVTLTVMDTGNASSAPGTASGMSTLVINGALTIPAFLFGNGVQGRAFSQSIPTTGGVQPLTSCMIANVPANSNLTVVVDPGMMSNCLVSGTPTAPGSSTTVSLTATDSAVAPSSPGTATSLNNSVTINSPLVIVSPARQINGLVGFPYTGATFTATGGTGNGTGLTWTQGGSVSASGLCAPAAPAPPGGIMLGGTTGTLTAATITLPAVKTTFLVCVEDTTTASTMAAAAAINVSATISVFDRKAFAGGDGGLSTLEIINTRTNLFSTSISLAGGTALPFGVAVTSDGSTVFVADNANNTIIGIDTITNAAITGSPFALPAGCGSPTELATTPDPVMAGHDRLYVVCTDTIGAHVEEVAVFDTTSSATLTAGAIAQVVTGVGSSPKAVTIQADNSLAYVTLNGLDQLAVINNTGAPAQVVGSPYNLDATTDQPTGIALATNGASLYAYIGKQGVVAGTQQGIEVEDVTSAATSITLVTDILLTSGVTFNPDVVAVDPAGAFVYVTLSTGQQFDVVDNTVVTPVLIAGAPFGLPDPAGAANDIPGGVTIPPVPSGTPLAYITGIDIAPPADEVAVINDLNPPTANGASPIAVTAGSGPGRIASIPIPK